MSKYLWYEKQDHMNEDKDKQFVSFLGLSKLNLVMQKGIRICTQNYQMTKKNRTLKRGESHACFFKNADKWVGEIPYYIKIKKYQSIPSPAVLCVRTYIGKKVYSEQLRDVGKAPFLYLRYPAAT